MKARGRRVLQYTPQVVEWLEWKSTKNMTYFFRDELKLIERSGKRPKKHMSLQNAIKLKESGLLKINRGPYGPKYMLTEKGIKLLQEEET